MSKQIKYLQFPIAVFLDSSVYIGESYNFSTRGDLSYLKRHIDSGDVILLTTDIVKKEVLKHMHEDVSEGVQSLQKAIDDRKLAIFRESVSYGDFLQKIDEEPMINEAKKIFETYLSDCGATVLSGNNDIDLDIILSDYFEKRPPFGERTQKK